MMRPCLIRSEIRACTIVIAFVREALSLGFRGNVLGPDQGSSLSVYSVFAIYGLGRR